ncbi:hypothetical protein [Sporosarcina sp. GW1-11]|uniref:hypothetical protein n=1 Tax=Sporosarcina sp. GW1-11 TaxID=2899126 RepID=UPI002953F306|nr:hypothetical protein [Sporosarcina sp. GW1-11]
MRQLAHFACWLMAGGNPPRAEAMIENRPLLTSVSIKSRATTQHKLVLLCANAHQN